MRFQFFGGVRLFFLIGWVVVGLYCSCLRAQPLRYSLQGKIAMTSYFIAGDHHPFSTMVNPSFMAGAKSVGWAFGGEQRFLAPGWTELAGAITIPVQRSVWGFFAGQEGLPVASDQLLLVTHARTLSKQASAGVSLGVNRKKAAALASVFSPAAAAGLSLFLSNELHTGVAYYHVANSSSTHVAADDHSVLHCTLSYLPTEKFAMTAAVTKERGQATTSAVSVYYRPSSRAGFRVGFSGKPSMCWAGLMVGIGKRVALQVYSGFYSLVGVSNGMSVYSGSPYKETAKSQDDP